MTAGLCVSPGFVPDATGISNLNPAYLRSILYAFDDLEPLKRTGKPFIITLNNQCAEVGPTFNRWKSAVRELCRRTGPDYMPVLGCGNEFDLYWANNKNDVPPEFAAELAIQAVEICHEYGIKVAPTSLAGPEWPAYLKELSKLCKGKVDYFDIHPYGKKPEAWHRGEDWMFGTLENTISVVQEYTGTPVICTEYGVKIGDAGSQEEVAAFLQEADKSMDKLGVDYWCWFAWSDMIGAPSERGDQAFGLLNETNVKRSAWYTFQAINGGGVTRDPLDKWSGVVGASILDMMRHDATEPTRRSLWWPTDENPATIEQNVGMNGVTYTWHLEKNKGWRIKAYEE